MRIFPKTVSVEIAAMLPDKPEGMGVSYKDRTFWNKVKESGKAGKTADRRGTRIAEKGDAAICRLLVSASEQDQCPPAGRKHDECPLPLSLPVDIGRMSGEQKTLHPCY